MVWGHNSATYLFAGSRYWKIDNATGKVELDYPRDMSTWQGIEYDIDDAFQWKDGESEIKGSNHRIILLQHLIKKKKKNNESTV